MKKYLRDTAKFLFFLAIGFFFIWLSLRNLSPNDKKSIVESLRNANYFWVFLCFVVGITSHFLRAYRWIILLEPLGYKPPLKITFYAVMTGYFVNMALPRFGEVTRCGVLNTYEKIPFTKSFGTVVTERAFDMIIFIILFLIIVFTQYGRFGAYLESHFFNPVREKLPNFDTAFHLFLWSGVLIIIAALILIYIYRKQVLEIKLFAKIWSISKSFLSGMRSLARIKRPFEFIFLTIGIWVLYFLMVYLCFFSIPETSHLGLDAGFAVLVLGSIGVIVIPGGIGIYPIIVAETLRSYLVGYNFGLALGWISWVAQAFMIISVGSISFILLSLHKRKHGL